ncbi:hypothetical protein H0X48_05780 [Candidatus Dependentiae bacterium]|nr:hypothetical protein [Tatlockia sp.]MBA3954800.1 hypothetical protein [Candidatus Dependentiae bacterium]
MNNIILKIDDTIFIEAILPCPVTKLEGCEQVTITLHKNEQSYTLYEYHCIQIAVEELNYLLKEAQESQLQLDCSIIKDIGYLANEYFQDRNKYLSFPAEKHKKWIGMKYLLWDSRERGIWIYNKNSEIFLEVTPFYSWRSIDPEEGENFITYEEFLKNYQSHLIVKLSKEVALEWLNKTEELLSIMKGNYEQCKYLHEAELKSID